MKPILHIVAIVVSCGAAVFSFSQSQKFQALEKDRAATVAENNKVSAEASAAQTETGKERELFAKSKENRELLAQGASSLKDEGTSLANDVSKLDSELKSQEADLSQLKKTLDQVNATLGGLEGGVTLETLPGKIEEIDKDKEDKKKKLEELKTLVSAAEKNITTGRSDLDRLARRTVERNSRIARNAMEAVVTAVNQDWGFLVIGAGSNSGFTPQTDLLVERDGRKIARVRPSSIEPTQTIAEIDMDSLAPGVRIQPGDRVLLAAPVGN